MAIFIDSGSIAEVREAIDLGYVTGVTTNPILMSKTEGDWRAGIREICSLTKGPVYYQIDVKPFCHPVQDGHPEPFDFAQGKLREGSSEHLLTAAEAIHKISPRQIVLKIPAAAEYYKLLSKISSHIACCVTAVYSEAQLIAAHEAGAKHVAVYVNRITRHCKDQSGPDTVRSMREIIDRHKLPIHILAASLKSSDEVVAAYKAGAHDVTTTLDVLKSLTYNSLSAVAVEEFNGRIK